MKNLKFGSINGPKEDESPKAHRSLEEIKNIFLEIPIDSRTPANISKILYQLTTEEQIRVILQVTPHYGRTLRPMPTATASRVIPAMIETLIESEEKIIIFFEALHYPPPKDSTNPLQKLNATSTYDEIRAAFLALPDSEWTPERILSYIQSLPATARLKLFIAVSDEAYRGTIK